jgi:hypothetical protein
VAEIHEFFMVVMNISGSGLSRVAREVAAFEGFENAYDDGCLKGAGFVMRRSEAVLRTSLVGCA